MCQPKSAGGKRCAVHQPAFLGVKLLLKEKYGLTEHQINYAYRNLRDRYKNQPEEATDEEYRAFIASQGELLESASPRVRNRAQNQFEKDVIINRSLLTAVGKLEKSAITQKTYIDGEIDKIAKTYHLDKGKVRDAYRKGLAEDVVNLDSHGDVVDAQTRYALIRANVQAVSDKEPSRRIVMFPVEGSYVVKRMGWSSEDGRLEMELENGVHAFRNVDEEQWEQVQTYPGGFLQHEAQLSYHQYDSPAQAAQDAYRVWCDTCKTYRLLSRNHKCEDEVSRAYRRIREGIAASEDESHQPLPGWARVWEKRPQKNLDETPTPENLRKLASEDDIVNFDFTLEHEEGVMKASLSAGRITPDYPTLIMNQKPRCTCKQAGKDSEVFCRHVTEFYGNLSDYHVKFSREDAEDNHGLEFPSDAGVNMRVEPDNLSTQQLRDVLSVVRRNRPVRLYVESEDNPVAGSIDFQTDGTAITANPALFCSKCSRVHCPHVTEVRNRMITQVEEGFYSPRARLHALAGMMAPEEPKVTGKRERNTIPYSQDVRQYVKDYRALKIRAQAGENIIPFEEGSVTKGMLGTSAQDGQGFGVELEFEFPDTPGGSPTDAQLAAITSELADRGLSKSDRHYEYGEGTRMLGYRNGWIVERDESVGGEVVSPVLYDNAEDWRKLREVCDVIKKHGGVATDRAGGHIHIGSPPNVDRDQKVMEFIMEHQDSLHRLNTHPDYETHRTNGYSAPFTNLSSQRALYAVQEGPAGTASREFACVGAKGGQTTEFRDPDGTLDPGTIQTHVMMYAALVKRAEQGELKPRGERHPIGYNHRRKNLLAGTREELTDEEVIVSDISFRHTVDELFDDPQDRQRLVALGVVNKWQPA